MNHVVSKKYLILYLAFFIESLSFVCGKFASAHNVMSFRFVLWYGLDVMVMGIFAIMWQQILKKMPLAIAYSYRPLVTILGVVYGVLFFHDKLSVTAVIGIVIIVAGIWMVNADE